MELIDEAIEHATFVKAKPEAVYDAITTAEGLDGWFTVDGEVDAKPGGHIKFRWKNWGVDSVSAEDGGPVIEADRPNKFVFEWNPDNNEYRTTVKMVFEPTEDGTIIRLRESGYQNTLTGRRAMMQCAVGWGEALTLLKVYLEHKISYK